MYLNNEGTGPDYPIMGYFDLSTAHLPRHELDILTTAPVVVHPHRYGFWVNVVSDFTNDDFDDLEWDNFPVLKKVLEYVRELRNVPVDINWINFDADARAFEDLPIY